MAYKNIDRLAQMEPFEIADVIRNDHPQIIAVILSMLDPDKAALTTTYFTQRLRNDVTLRSCTMDLVDLKWVRLADRGIGLTLRDIGNRQYLDITNKNSYIRSIPKAQLVEVFMNMREYDPELAEIVMEELGICEEK